MSPLAYRPLGVQDWNEGDATRDDAQAVTRDPTPVWRVRVIFRAFVLGLLLLGFAAPSAAAQQPNPKRPKLATGVDTNDAQAYLDLGRRELENDAGVAMRAFYWSARLQPDLASAHYGRVVAQMLDDHDLLAIHFDGGGNQQERESDKMVDSIYALSFGLDPFLQRVWDKTLLIAYYDLRIHSDGSMQAKREIEEQISTFGPSWKAWLFYSAGRYREALDFYALASRREPKNDAYLARRAELHMRLLEPDSAFKYFAEAIKVAGAAERNKDRLVRFYKPKAVYEYMTGFVHEMRGNLAQAREAYGRALVEDLSLFVAHQRIGLLALGAGDTTTALSELRLATEVAPNNAVLRYQYAVVLTRAGRLPEAVPELRKVIETEPWYPDPYMLLARLYDSSDLKDDARTLYRDFLARSRRDDAQRPFALERMAAIGTPPTNPPELR